MYEIKREDLLNLEKRLTRKFNSEIDNLDISSTQCNISFSSILSSFTSITIIVTGITGTNLQFEHISAQTITGNQIYIINGTGGNGYLGSKNDPVIKAWIKTLISQHSVSSVTGIFTGITAQTQQTNILSANTGHSNVFTVNSELRLSGASSALLSANNLSDLGSKIQARINLEVSAATEIQAALDTKLEAGDLSGVTQGTFTAHTANTNAHGLNYFHSWSGLGSYSGNLSSSTEINNALDLKVDQNHYGSFTSDTNFQLNYLNNWSGNGSYSGHLSSSTELLNKFSTKLNIDDFNLYTGSAISGFSNDINALQLFSAYTTAITNTLQSEMSYLNIWSAGSYSAHLSSATEVNTALSTKLNVNDFINYTGGSISGVTNDINKLQLFSAVTTGITQTLQSEIGYLNSWSGLGSYSGHLLSSTEISNALDLKVDQNHYGSFSASVNNYTGITTNEILALKNHTGNTNNPHSVSTTQIGSYTSGETNILLSYKVDNSHYSAFTGSTYNRLGYIESWSGTGSYSGNLSSSTEINNALLLKSDLINFTAHTANTNNPHNVTLSNVLTGIASSISVNVITATAITCAELTATTSISAASVNIGRMYVSGTSKFGGKTDFKGGIEIGGNSSFYIIGSGDGSYFTQITSGDCSFTGGTLISAKQNVYSGIVLNSKRETLTLPYIHFSGSAIGSKPTVSFIYDHINNKFKLNNKDRIFRVQGNQLVGGSLSANTLRVTGSTILDGNNLIYGHTYLSGNIRTLSYSSPAEICNWSIVSSAGTVLATNERVPIKFHHLDANAGDSGLWSQALAFSFSGNPTYTYNNVRAAFVVSDNTGLTGYTARIDVYDDQSGLTPVFESILPDKSGINTNYGPAVKTGLVQDVVHAKRSWSYSFQYTKAASITVTWSATAPNKGFIPNSIVNWSSVQQVGIPVPFKCKLKSVSSYCNTIDGRTGSNIKAFIYIGVSQPSDINTGGTTHTTYLISELTPTLMGANLTKSSIATRQIDAVEILQSGAIINAGISSDGLGNSFSFSTNLIITFYFEEVD